MAVVGGACSAAARRRVPAAVVSSSGDLERSRAQPARRIGADRADPARIATSRACTSPPTARWRMYGADGTTLLALPQPRERWLLEQDGRRVTARREDASAVPLRESPIVVRPLDPGGTIAFNGKRWRGELLVSATDDGLLVVNRRADGRLSARASCRSRSERRAAADAAAVEAQAVTARSYAVTHLGEGRRAYDMTRDDAGPGVRRRRRGDGAWATGRWMRRRGSCCSTTARSSTRRITPTAAATPPSRRTRGVPSAEPYLQRVSDQIPGTIRFYCDQAPRFRWTRVIAGDELRRTGRALRAESARWGGRRRHA